MRITWGHNLPMRHFHAFLEPYPNKPEEKKIMHEVFKKASFYDDDPEEENFEDEDED